MVNLNSGSKVKMGSGEGRGVVGLLRLDCGREELRKLADLYGQMAELTGKEVETYDKMTGGGGRSPRMKITSVYVACGIGVVSFRRGQGEPRPFDPTSASMKRLDRVLSDRLETGDWKMRVSNLEPLDIVYYDPKFFDGSHQGV